MLSTAVPVLVTGTYIYIVSEYVAGIELEGSWFPLNWHLQLPSVRRILDSILYLFLMSNVGVAMARTLEALCHRGASLQDWVVG